MTERDLDIDFDFFDESETSETVEAQRLPRRGQQRPPSPPRPPTSLAPLLRLVGLIAFAIVIVVVLVFWVQSCTAANKHARYKNYMDKIATIGTRSAGLGATFNHQLTTPGIKLADLDVDLRGLARQSQQLVDQAQAVAPPGPLRPYHQHVVEALQFRVNGLTGLADAFAIEGAAKSTAGAGQRLAAQADRFVASDIVWADLFQTPAKQELERQGVRDVRVPGSVFVQNPDLASRRTMALILRRIRGAAVGPAKGGLHGTGIVSVQVLPGLLTLSPTKETKVPVGLNLAFRVTVKDTGDSLETQIPVTLTIQQSTPIVRKQTIDLINPGDSKTLLFKDFPNPTLGALVHVKVDVTPVLNESNKTNNTASYPVIFSLP